MWSHRVIPVQECFNIGVCVAVFLVDLEPFHDLAVALWVFDPTEDLLDAVGIKPFAKVAIAAIIRRELAAVVADALPDHAMLER